MRLLFLLMLLPLPVMSQTIILNEFNYPVADIAEKKMSKEVLYKDMNRTLVRIQDSICSNRAHVWSFQFKKQEIEAPKIFLFFTKKTGTFDGNSWWYHVAPMVNEKGRLWVMDAGFPKKFGSPVTVEYWLKTFNGADSQCKEIKSDDNDLVERMFRDEAFPEITKHGKYNCYYKITPPGYWTPSHVAQNLSGHDERGRPVSFNRDVMDIDEVMEACIEASTNPIGWTWGTTLGKCRYFVNH